jgi:hypothetical protein
MPDQPYFDYQSYTPPMTHAGPPIHTKIVRIQDEQYQFAPHGSQSAFVSSEFAEEDDYYSAHLGAAAKELQDEEYYQANEYDHCYAAITAENSDPPTSETGPIIPPSTMPTCLLGSSRPATWLEFTNCRSARSQAQWTTG